APTFFLLLFSLAEIEFYFGPILCSLVADLVSACANACSVLIVPSVYNENQVLTRCKVSVPIFQIPHGVNLPSLPNNTLSMHKHGKVISISRFAEHKNIDCLLEAWGLVHSQVPEATLTLVGSGSFIAHSKSTMDGVRYAGEVTDT